MLESSSKPFLTFAVFAYNQERFVREAVEAAFAQTHSPLEIILSDDCSWDGTFEIMKCMAACYQGSHRIVLNRNPSNFGVAGHVNLVVGLAQGELIVAAAGDDVSLPQRASALSEAWVSTGRRATSIHSRIVHIDESGNQIKHPVWHIGAEPTHHVTEQVTTPSECVDTLKPGVFGCSGAYTPSLFKAFGGLPKDVIHEDNIITLRSVLLGRVLFIDSVLVKYRLHGRNLFNSRQGIAATLDSINEQEDRMKRNFASRAAMYRAFCKDLLTAHKIGIVSDQEYFKAIGIAQRQERIYSLESAFMTSNTARKACLLVQLARAGAGPSQLKKLSIRLLPTPLLKSTKLARGWLNNGRNRQRF